MDTHETVHKSEETVSKIQETDHNPDVPVNTTPKPDNKCMIPLDKAQEHADKSEDPKQSINTQQEKVNGKTCKPKLAKVNVADRPDPEIQCHAPPPDFGQRDDQNDHDDHKYEEERRYCKAFKNGDTIGRSKGNNRSFYIKTDSYSGSSDCDFEHFVEEIGGLRVKFLVDTGTTTTLLACKMFDQISERDTSNLEPSNLNIKDVNGKRLPVTLCQYN
ncbi:Hypothetical predicted protein [Mytilus galloprovincialis]|uniref:Peptidase A2 domain-containing protein n=1 Tax=Mytilus galloprovincialis TaxID=29158 RepID=A0A8B6GBI3_MYTGA|nr:Hypothetical predicted protein [Mytilus galloprovincialis]